MTQSNAAVLHTSLGEDLCQHTAKVAPAAFEGLWATIELQPDAFARQTYSVGVVVVDPEGVVRSFELLADLRGLKTLYSRAALSRLKPCLEAARRALEQAVATRALLQDMPWGSSKVFCTQPWFTSGESPQAIVARLFQDVIPLLRKGNDPDKAPDPLLAQVQKDWGRMQHLLLAGRWLAHFLRLRPAKNKSKNS